MSRLPVALLAAVSLLALAGCSGGLGPGGATPSPEVTVTPAPLPTEAVERYPPGVTAAGVDRAAFAKARVDALADRQYLERSRTAVRVDGRVVLDQRLVSRHGSGTDRLRLSRVALDSAVLNDSVVAADIWTNGSYTVQRLETGDGRVRFEAREYLSSLAAEPHRGYAAALAASQTRTETRRSTDGTVRYTLVATAVPTGGPWYAPDGLVRFERRGRARATVTDAGVLERFVVEFPVSVDGRSGTLRHTYRLTDERVGVDRPDWFDEAVTNG